MVVVVAAVAAGAAVVVVVAAGACCCCCFCCCWWWWWWGVGIVVVEVVVVAVVAAVAVAAAAAVVGLNAIVDRGLVYRWVRADSALGSEQLAPAAWLGCHGRKPYMPARPGSRLGRGDKQGKGQDPAAVNRRRWRQWEASDPVQQSLLEKAGFATQQEPTPELAQLCKCYEETLPEEIQAALPKLEAAKTQQTLQQQLNKAS